MLLLVVGVACDGVFLLRNVCPALHDVVMRTPVVGFGLGDVVTMAPFYVVRTIVHVDQERADDCSSAGGDSRSRRGIGLGRLNTGNHEPL